MLSFTQKGRRTTHWPVVDDEVQFLVTVERGVLKLQESCMHSIFSRMSSIVHRVKFLTLVGSQGTSGRAQTAGFESNTARSLSSAMFGGADEGIAVFQKVIAPARSNQQEQCPPFIRGIGQANIANDLPFILQPWAPAVDSQTYTALIDFCVMVSTNDSAHSIEDYALLMRSTIERCNSSKSMNPTTSVVCSVSVKVREQIATKIQFDYRKQFVELKTSLLKVLYLDEDALSREFNNFVEQTARNTVSIYLKQVKNEKMLKDIVESSFKNDFDSFRQEYSAKATKFSKLEDQLNAKFSKIEQDLKTAWRDGSLKEFLQSLSQRYMFDIGAFDFPSEDYNLMPQWQLRFTKRHDHHEKCVRSAVLVVQRVEKSLEASFTNYLTNPKTVAVPVKPTILEYKGAFNEITSLQSFVEEALSEKYNFMLQVSEGQNKKIQERLAETERALREETKRIFQLQVKSSPASTTAITLSKP